MRTGSPCLVETLKHHRVERLACGKNFTVVITMNAEQQAIAASRGDQRFQTTHVYSWGRNDFGQLGHQQIQSACIPTRVDAFDVLDEDIIEVSCGSAHALFLTSDYDVISCGSNFFGQCGFDPEECEQTDNPYKVAAFDGLQVSMISAGYQHSLFLTAQGKVYSSGNN